MMKRAGLIATLSLVFTLAFFVTTPRTAEAAVVKVKVKAEVSAPYLVVKPPRPLVKPRRITMRLHRPGVTHVRLFGHHHHHHVVRVGHHAPRLHFRSRLKPHVHVAGPRVHVDAPHVHVHRPEPKVKVDVHIGGPHVHVHPGKGHGPKHGPGGKGKFKGKAGGKGKIKF